jgi:hypothetical protein
VRKKTFAIDIDGTITENGGGTINLDALSALRHLKEAGHNVIFVSGRSSVEGFLLSVFGGVTRTAVGENGGCITYGPNEHTLIGQKQECIKAFEFLRSKLENVKEKPVFPRMTEVVLQRTFDIKEGRKILSSYDVTLTDSMYAYHINSKGVDKGSGFEEVMKKLSVAKEDVIAIGDSETDIPLFKRASLSIALGNSSDFVKSNASMVVSTNEGDGVIEALGKIAPKLAEI